MKESLILIVEPERGALAELTQCFAGDYQVVGARTGKEASDFLETSEVDVILSNLRFKDMSGLDLFAQSRVTQPEAVRILVAEHKDLENINRDINDAAIYQVIRKPWHPTALRLMVRRALESRELSRRHRYLNRALKFSDAIWDKEIDTNQPSPRQSLEFDKLVFVSEPMMRVCSLAQRGAVTDLPILIQGETGTGKELLARAVHAFSKRRDNLFLVQNCGALPDELLQSELFGHKRGAFTGAISDRLGLFPAADGGTVFLDEISDVSPAFQVSLLRFLQEGEVKPIGTERTRKCNVRVIAASNRPLKGLVESGEFRRDLYYRLRGFELNLPALRERVEDIPVLAEHLANRYAESIGRRIPGIALDVMRRLKVHTWTGNVRELENEMRRMVALAENGEFLSTKHLSEELAVIEDPRSTADLSSAQRSLMNSGATLKETVERIERQLVSQSLIRNKWNHSKSARELGLSRVGLTNKIKRYGLEQVLTRAHSAGGENVD
ncbi:MAG: sigma-54-dependent Fis family transcriptional regulator [Acidobacteria bacterium]|nr:sigma-54-dependent Fis family transcriptional regulator [Acidobacteriota bacterium]